MFFDYSIQFKSVFEIEKNNWVSYSLQKSDITNKQKKNIRSFKLQYKSFQQNIYVRALRVYEFEKLLKPFPLKIKSFNNVFLPNPPEWGLRKPRRLVFLFQRALLTLVGHFKYVRFDAQLSFIRTARLAYRRFLFPLLPEMLLCIQEFLYQKIWNDFTVRRTVRFSVHLKSFVEKKYSDKNVYIY